MFTKIEMLRGNSTYCTKIGDFIVGKHKHDINGNPVYQICVVGVVGNLPKIAGFRRDNKLCTYNVKSYNIDESMRYLIRELEKEYAKGNKPIRI